MFGSASPSFAASVASQCVQRGLDPRGGSGSSAGSRPVRRRSAPGRRRLRRRSCRSRAPARAEEACSTGDRTSLVRRGVGCGGEGDRDQALRAEALGACPSARRSPCARTRRRPARRCPRRYRRPRRRRLKTTNSVPRTTFVRSHQLEAVAQVRLVGAEAAHRLVVGEAREGRRSASRSGRTVRAIATYSSSISCRMSSCSTKLISRSSCVNSGWRSARRSSSRKQRAIWK